MLLPAWQWGVTLDLALMVHSDPGYVCECVLHRSWTGVIFGEERWQLMSWTQVMVTMVRGTQGWADEVMQGKVIVTKSSTRKASSGSFSSSARYVTSTIPVLAKGWSYMRLRSGGSA